jgi:hypothetical protein
MRTDCGHPFPARSLDVRILAETEGMEQAVCFALAHKGHAAAHTGKAKLPESTHRNTLAA